MTSASHTCGCTHLTPCPAAKLLFDGREEQALRWHLQQTAQAAIDGKAPKTDKIRHHKVPVASAKTWKAETAPLRAFLKAKPRDWPALRAWADANRIPEYRLHNQVAWLEGAGLARAHMSGVPGREERQTATWRAA
jgi:hypothetical protein